MTESIYQFAEAARGFLGTPYRHQGRGREGLDCVGLLVASAEIAGIMRPGDAPPADYGRDPDGRLPGMLKTYCRRRTDKEIVEIGDILMIKFTHDPQHVMIVLDPGFYGPLVVHAIQPDGVIAHRLTSHWFASHRARLAGVYQIKNRDMAADSEGDQ